MVEINEIKDFYNDINKEWLIQNPVPSDYSSWNNFSKLYESTQTYLKNIVKNLDNKNTLSFKLFDSGFNGRNNQYLNTLLNLFDNYETKEELLGHLLNIGISTPLDIDVAPDAKKSDEYVLYISQGGLGFPDRDYYYPKDNNENYKNGYINLMSKLCQIENPLDLYNFEKKLASFHLTKTGRRDGI